ncbi:MAG: tetratricopeptide repeat protein, partial [Asticcacaulis sp.]
MNAFTAYPDRDALLQQAKELSARHNIPQALRILARLEALYPHFSRLYQARGHCYVLLGEAQAAIAALRTAVQLNPTLPMSWDMLAQLYALSGDPQRAAEAAQQLAVLKALPPEV